MTAAKIVTPRVDTAAVSEDASAQEVDKVFAETGFSRLPVYRGTIDNITGVLLFKDFYYEAITKGRPLPEIVKPVVFITKTMKIPKLLRTMQEKQAHMAVMVDEFGGTMGIVTLEDIVEELVGDIWDEHDKIVEEFRLLDDGIAVMGSANLQDMFTYIAKTIGYTVPEEAVNIPGTTVGNWILEIKGALPHPGDHLVWHNLQITITRVQRHRVMEIMVASD
jgi:CBS domain containing-hemolysin-like protein